MPTQCVQYLDVEEMRNVHAYSCPSHPLADNRRGTIEIQEHGDRGRSVEDDQKPSAEVAWIVGVPHSTCGDLRRLVQLHGLVPPHHL